MILPIYLPRMSIYMGGIFTYPIGSILCMSPATYKLTEPIGDFSDGDILEVTTRFGAWHSKDVKLESQSPTSMESIELTSEQLDAVTMPVEQFETIDRHV